MHRREFLSRSFACWLASSSACCVLCGCGTIFHAERVGQPHSHDIDWGVAALNGLGLVMFFVPGVVAFAVDFYTGAIYLPPEQDPSAGTTAHQGSGPASAPTDGRWFPQRASSPTFRRHDGPGGVPSLSCSTVRAEEFRRVDVLGGTLSRQSIENAVAQHIGRPLDLTDCQVRVSPLADLRAFARQWRRHHADRDFGRPSASVFNAQSTPSPDGHLS